ncbi:MAG: hypothetical protein JSU70_15705 [Phycisphaerales bacterium]|nr:MAG: hypothetical protein JSU70_15705 [Phycisphaerales bacterium]
MADESNIKEELLKQMEKDSDGSTRADENPAKKIIGHYQAQAKRLKTLTILSWAITVFYFFAMHSLRDFLLKSDLHHFLTENEFLLISYTGIGLKVLIVVSVLVTYLCYCKSKALTMIQICARLASIEEQLKRLSEDK